MIKLRKWQWIAFATVLSVALWTLISVNTGMFVSNDKFDYLNYITSYVLTAAIWFMTAVKINLSETVRKVISWIIFLLTPFFCMQTAMLLAGEAEFTIGIYFINVLFYFALLSLMLAAARNLKWASILTVLIAAIFNIAIFVVNIFRGTPLIPIDFLALGTAAHVVGNYSFQLKYQLITATVITLFVVALASSFSFKFKFKRKNIILSVGSVILTAAFIVCMSFVDYTNVNMDFFNQNHANNTHGTAYSFYINIRKMILHKPDNYDENRAKTLLDAAGEKEDKSEEEVDITQRPNIIAIMNESFSDLSVVGDFETEEDYMPFIRSFTDNTVKGQLLVSPFGGNTCNTEFEFMTGLSMGLVPTGSTPYMQYITKEFPLSLPAHLSDLGYKTVAVHPYSGKCWNRLKVYGLFRFEKFISIENLNEYIDEGDWEYIRNYLSDNTSFKAVTKQLEEKSDDERMFIFNVTMQNHGGYDYNDTPFEGLHITNMKGEYPETEQYLAAIRETDKAYENLINYLKDFDEPTIVLMFGDHQPAVEQEFFEELYGQSLDDVDLEDLQKRYTIPFIIWANYDIEDKAGVKTSPNYLSNLLLDTAGVPKNELGMFTEEISESIPQLNVMGHYDSDGVWSVNDISSTALLKDYEDVEYYLLTRKEN